MPVPSQMRHTSQLPNASRSPIVPRPRHAGQGSGSRSIDCHSGSGGSPPTERTELTRKAPVFGSTAPFVGSVAGGVKPGRDGGNSSRPGDSSVLWSKLPAVFGSTACLMTYLRSLRSLRVSLVRVPSLDRPPAGVRLFADVREAGREQDAERLLNPCLIPSAADQLPNLRPRHAADASANRL